MALNSGSSGLQVGDPAPTSLIFQDVRTKAEVTLAEVMERSNSKYVHLLMHRFYA